MRRRKFTLIWSQVTMECALGDTVKFSDFAYRDDITFSSSIANFLNSGGKQGTLVIG